MWRLQWRSIKCAVPHARDAKESKKKQIEIPLFSAAAINKLLSGHWVYVRRMIELPTAVSGYLSVAKEVQLFL